MPERVIHAFHEVDLERFLKNLNLFEAIEKGEIKCDVCKCQVTKENLGFVYPLEGKIKVCCDKMYCYYEVMREMKKE